MLYVLIMKEVFEFLLFEKIVIYNFMSYEIMIVF